MTTKPEASFDLKGAVWELKDSKCDVLSRAALALCEHYRCRHEDLTLDRTSEFPQLILRKERTGLAYLVKLKCDDTTALPEFSVRWIAEPIYLGGEVKPVEGEV